MIIFFTGDREPTLQCFNVTNTRLLTFTCISPDGDINSSSCAFDRGPFSPCKLILFLFTSCITLSWLFFHVGDLDFYEIDQYSFTPGTRVFTVEFNLTTGEEGTYQDTFEAFRRERTYNIFCQNQLVMNVIIVKLQRPYLDFHRIMD